MAGLLDVNVPGLANLLRRVSRLEAELKKLASSPYTVGRATVAAGGSLVIQGALRIVGMLDLTGTLSMKSEAGDELIRMGAMPNGDRGVQFSREDGSLALELRKNFPTDPEQAWSLYDAAGNLIIGEYQELHGLKAPFLEHPFQPVSATSGTAVTCGPYGWERTHAPGVATGTWQTLFAYDGKRQNAFLDLKVAAICSDGTTAGELQIVDLNTGLQLPGFIDPAWTGVIPAGTTTLTVLDPTPSQAGIHVAGDVGGQMRVGLQCRRTAGAGSITLSVAQAIGG